YNDISVDGVWTSESGNVSSWTRIAGTGSLTNPEAWPAQGGYGRVVLAVAPSNENILYALYYNNQSYPNLEADFFKYDRLLNTWEDRSDNLPDETGGSAGNDPFAVQGGYDLVVAVKPDNENVVFIGGTNIYRSNDGFASKTNTTRIGGYATASAYNMYPNSHPDIHAIVFDPLSPSIMICGNDGGMQKTFDCMASSVLWTPINTGFRTFQYYYVTVDPRTGNNKVMGGAQDNGTTRNIGGSGTNMEMILGGDGVAVGLSNTISGQNYEYVGWQFGQIIRRNATAPDGSGTVIRPSTATSNGLFVTLFHLDPDNSNTLYYANTNLLFRNVSASTATTLNWTNMSGIATTVTTSFNITALAATRGTYNATKSNLFFGTSNGRVFRLDDPGNAAAASIPVNISGSFPASGYVSSISVNPRNDDTVLVSFSNYNVTSIWWTGNANAASPTWQNVEGNLTIPSVRSSAIALTSDGIEYFVGTSVGLYKAATINGSNAAATSWTQEGVSEVGNAVITSLSLRPSDNKLLVGTHGYGMWATSLSLTTLPVNLLEFNGNIKNENVFLEWKATHDSDEGGFEIEKSEDGTSFRKIGFIKLRSANGPSAYSFVDGEAASEKNYYRLRMFELNSTAKYSHVLVFRNDNSQQVFVNNPFVHQLEIRFAKLPKKLRIQISDASGRIVMQRQYNNLSSPRLVIQDLNGIGKGMYFMQTDADGKMFTSKIIRQ
ncbi:MAG: T9SS type A sorting domain-containing protein, partial [Flavisolibacter sp.]|nr:T9SS type A sorting domain-containing protein [Flavisolibacter sp.]